MAVTIDGSNSVTINSGSVLGITSGVVQNSTSGTNIDFTSIPSWVKRITVMFNGVSTSGTSAYLVQLGYSGGVESSGYTSWGLNISTTPATGASISTAGFILNVSSAASAVSGALILQNVSGNVWVGTGNFYFDTARGGSTGGGKTISGGALDRIRITTVNGTDTFDAGSINILYE